MSADENGAIAVDIGLVAVPDVLTTVSHEVRLLSDTAAELQNVIGNLLTSGGIAGSASLYQLQSLDGLCQGLEAISDFVGELSKQAMTDWKVDVGRASQSIRLSEMSQRVNGTSRIAADEGTGDFDCFDSWQLTG